MHRILLLPIVLTLALAAGCAPTGGQPGPQAPGIVAPHGGRLVGQNGGAVVGQNGAAIVGQNGAAIVGQNGAAFTERVGTTPPAPLGPAASASIIGKLKSAPAAVIGPEDGAAPGLSGLYRLAARQLQSLEEAPVAGAAVQLVDLAGQPLSDEVATTDAEGGFRLGRPPGATEGLVRARFRAEGAEVEYMALAPDGDEVALDTATTLLAARWRAARRAGQATSRPDGAVLDRLRGLLKADRIPHMASDSPDLAEAFDQLAAEDAPLQTLVGASLGQPSRSWRVGAWHSEATLREQGVLAPDGQLTRAETGVFSVDRAGTLHLVVGAGTPRIERLTATGERLDPLALPAGAQGPYAVTFSPAGTLHLLARDARGRVTTHRWRAGGFEPLFTGARPPEWQLALALGGIAASEQGEVYMADRVRHVVWRARPGATELAVHAGGLGQAGHRDGPGGEARFDVPWALALDDANRLYVGDTRNRCVRRVTPDGRVRTVAGAPEEATPRLGRGRHARLGEPAGLALAPDGTLYVSDVGGRRVVRLTRGGSVFLVAGDGRLGNEDGPGRQARFKAPMHLAIDAAGTLYVQDLASLDGLTARFVLRKVTPEGPGR
jgi:hypothetical protein